MEGPRHFVESNVSRTHCTHQSVLYHEFDFKQSSEQRHPEGEEDGEGNERQVGS